MKSSAHKQLLILYKNFKDKPFTKKEALICLAQNMENDDDLTSNVLYDVLERPDRNSQGDKRELRYLRKVSSPKDKKVLLTFKPETLHILISYSNLIEAKKSFPKLIPKPTTRGSESCKKGREFEEMSKIFLEQNPNFFPCNFSKIEKPNQNVKSIFGDSTMTKADLILHGDNKTYGISCKKSANAQLMMISKKRLFKAFDYHKINYSKSAFSGMKKYLGIGYDRRFKFFELTNKEQTDLQELFLNNKDFILSFIFSTGNCLETTYHSDYLMVNSKNYTKENLKMSPLLININDYINFLKNNFEAFKISSNGIISFYGICVNMKGSKSNRHSLQFKHHIKINKFK